MARRRGVCASTRRGRSAHAAQSSTRLPALLPQGRRSSSRPAPSPNACGPVDQQRERLARGRLDRRASDRRGAVRRGRWPARVYRKTGRIPRPAIISVYNITMDSDATVCVITDRLAQGQHQMKVTRACVRRDRQALRARRRAFDQRIRTGPCRRHPCALPRGGAGGRQGRARVAAAGHAYGIGSSAPVRLLATILELTQTSIDGLYKLLKSI